MPNKKKRTFRASKAVKSAAREKIGSPRPSRVIPEKTKRATPKHKPTFGELLKSDE